MSIRQERARKKIINGEMRPDLVDRALKELAEYPHPQVVWLQERNAGNTYGLRWKPDPDLLGHTKGGWLIITLQFSRYVDVVKRARAILKAQVRRKGVQSIIDVRTKNRAAKMAV